MRVVGPSTHEFIFLADDNLARKLDQLRGLLAHKLSQATMNLQIDHIQPRALGGTHNESNLRLLCRSCNQRAAVEKLGLLKMRGYLDEIC